MNKDEKRFWSNVSCFAGFLIFSIVAPIILAALTISMSGCQSTAMEDFRDIAGLKAKKGDPFVEQDNFFFSCNGNAIYQEDWLLGDTNRLLDEEKFVFDISEQIVVVAIINDMQGARIKGEVYHEVAPETDLDRRTWELVTEKTRIAGSNKSILAIPFFNFELFNNLELENLGLGEYKVLWYINSHFVDVTRFLLVMDSDGYEEIIEEMMEEIENRMSQEETG